MKQQLLTLQQLIGLMDPELYRHLGSLNTHLVQPTVLTRITEKVDGLNLFFCYRYCASSPVAPSVLMVIGGF